MSILTCTLCDSYSSTDDGTGVFEDTGTGFFCERCVSEAIENPTEHQRIMAALKVQDFEAWRQSISLHEGTPE